MYQNSFSMGSSFSKMFPDLSALFPIIIVIIIIFIVFKRKNIGNSFKAMNLVLTNYSLDLQTKILEFEARKGGFISFVMEFLKIQNKTTLSLLQDKGLHLETTNLNGNTKTSITLYDITSIECGYKNNLKTVIIFGFVLFLLLFKFAVVSIIGGVILAIWYFQSRLYTLTLIANNGQEYIFGFSPTVLGNISMNQERLVEMQNLLFEAKKQ